MMRIEGKEEMQHSDKIEGWSFASVYKENIKENISKFSSMCLVDPKGKKRLITMWVIS